MNPTPASSPSPTPVSAPSVPSARSGLLALGEVGLVVAIVADTVAGQMAYKELPPTVPIHWNIHGTPDGFGPAWVNALLMPGIIWFMYVLMRVLPRFDRRAPNYAEFPGAYFVIRAGLIGFFIAVHAGLLAVSLGHSFDISVAIRLLVPGLFVLLGSQFRHLKPNYFVGLRVPWTLNSDAVWEKTHRLAGQVWMIGGVAQAALVFAPSEIGVVAMLVLMIPMLVIPIVASQRWFKAESAALATPVGPRTNAN